MEEETQQQSTDSNLFAEKWQKVEKYLVNMKNGYQRQLQQEFITRFEPLEIDKEMTADTAEPIKTLRNLRNSTVRERKYGFGPAKISTLLQGGAFVLIHHYIGELKEWTKKTENMFFGGLFGLLKKASGLEFVYVSENINKEAVIYKCGERNWIYNSENYLVIGLQNTILKIKFEFAVRKNCAQELMNAFSYTNSQILIHIYGENPGEQLSLGGFLNSCNASIVLDLVETPRSERNFATQGRKAENKEDKPEIVKFPCLYIAVQDYLTFAVGLERLLCESSLKIEISEESKKLCSELIDDLLLLQTIVPFCRCDPSSAKHPSQTSVLSNFLSSLKSIQKLEKCSFVYSQLFERIAELKKTVEDIFPYEKHPAEAIKDVKLNDLCSQISFTEETNTQHQGYGYGIISDLQREPRFNLVSRMCHYLDSSDDFSVFDRLDKILRVGNMDIFDNVYGNISSLYRVMEDETKNLSHFYQCLFTEDSKRELIVLGERRVDKNKLEFFAGLILKKINCCWKLLEEINEATRAYFNFDLKNWEKLYQIRRELRHNSDWLEKNKSFVIVENSSDGEDSWHIYNKYQASDFEFGQDLGSGNFGQCFIANHPDFGRVAIKEFLWDVLEEQKKKEIDMFIKLRANPNIVKLLGLYYSSSEYYDELPQGIIMEYVEITLEKLIHDHEMNYTLEDALKRMKGVANAMAAMHAIGIVHRDLKPSNVLVTSRDTIRVCDFGTAEELKKINSFHGYGSPKYKSPEMLSPHDTVNEKTDVYSFAICMWEEIHRIPPYYGYRSNNDIYKLVLNNERPCISDGVCPRKLCNIIRQSWDQRPELRPSMEEIERSISNLFGDLPKGQLQTYLSEDVIQQMLL